MTIEAKQANAFAKLINKLEIESDYLLYESGERKMSEDKAASMIDSIQAQKNSTILLAEMDGKLIGHLMCMGGRANRNKHTVYIVTGVLRQYQGQGIATELFSQMEEWAIKQEIHRLELTVMVHNEAAFQLYKKMGFILEGIKRHSLQINREWVDEYYMAKIIV